MIFLPTAVISVRGRSKLLKKLQDTEKGPTVYCALKKEHHHKSVQDLEKKDDPPPISPDSTEKEKMLYRLQTKAGRTKYKKLKRDSGTCLRDYQIRNGLSEFFNEKS